MANAKKIFRVALIGCGAVSENHIRALLALNFVEIVALCDKIPSRAQAKAAALPKMPSIYTDYIEMMDTEKPDAVHIATPHFLHAEMAIEALSRNIHVFLEKPVGISEDEIEAIADAQKKSSAQLCVCFQNRFNPTTVLAKQIADEDGGVLAAYASLFWDRDIPYYKNSDWRGNKATEGGGVMINQAIHSIDLLTFFLGIPKKVCATTANHHLKGIIEVEDSCEGVITFASGARASFYATTAFTGGNETEIFLKTKNHKIRITPPHLYLDGESVDVGSIPTVYDGKECYGNGHRALIALFYQAISEGKESPVTLESAQYALRILLAAYRSSDNEIDL